MGHAQHRAAPDPTRISSSQMPRDSSSPVVSHHECFRSGDCIQNTDNILNEQVDRIVGNVCRFVTQVKTALIWCDDPVSGRNEVIDLSVPGEPELGKTVQKN